MALKLVKKERFGACLTICIKWHVLTYHLASFYTAPPYYIAKDYSLDIISDIISYVSSKRKLLKKLRDGVIDANDLRTLLRQKGWELRNTVGSHEHWRKGGVLYTLATHSKELKPYMIKQAKNILLGESDEKNEKA